MLRTLLNIEDISLNRLGLDPVHALNLLEELVDEAGRGRMRGINLVRRCRELIRLGAHALVLEHQTVSFSVAVSALLEARGNRRPRTIAEIHSITSKLQLCVPGLSQRKVRGISAADCQKMIEENFSTPRQQAKARTILHGLFNLCLQRGWCTNNPVSALPHLELKEAEIQVLPWFSLRRLLSTSLLSEHRPCMAAVGLMLWAGVRPAEVQRLGWEDIDWDEEVISLRSRHTKTGGCRHITLHKVLAAWLTESGIQPCGSICPRNWATRWKNLRYAAGAVPWIQDVLRHTFASYHIKQWHSFERLQEEMGHRSSRLLRTRYLSMKGITKENVARFWDPKTWLGYRIKRNRRLIV